MAQFLMLLKNQKVDSFMQLYEKVLEDNEFNFKDRKMIIEKIELLSAISPVLELVSNIATKISGTSEISTKISLVSEIFPELNAESLINLEEV